jgi:sugar-specific transcriptional regulator TrmB
MEAPIEEILTDIGLSKKEIIVYLSMLKLGEETASRISELSDLNRVTTYGLLKSLSEKGFCSSYDKNNVQFFKPSSPESVLGLLEEKKKRFRLIISQLKQEEKKATEKPKVAIFEGKKGIASLMSLILEDAENKKEVLGYGNVSAGEKTISQQSFYWRKTRLEKKIKMRAVSNYTGDAEHKEAKGWKKITEVRTIKDLEKNNTYTIIAENLLGYFVPGIEPIGILIKNKDIVEKEKFNFEILWEKAK